VEVYPDERSEDFHPAECNEDVYPAEHSEDVVVVAAVWGRGGSGMGAPPKGRAHKSGRRLPD